MTDPTDAPSRERFEEMLREGASSEEEVEFRRMMAAVGQAIAQELIREYPQIAATDPDRIKKAAAAAAQDLAVLEDFVPSIEGNDVPRWGVRIVQEPALVGMEPKTLGSFGAPRRIEDCINTDEVIMSLTIYGLVTNHLQRAILYLHGYRIVWLGGKKPEAEA